MKKIFFSLTLVSFIAIGCSSNQPKEQEKEQEHGTHQHEDGTIHKDHEAVEHQQEEFTPASDTTAHSKEQQGHDHGHSHTH